MGEIEPCTDMKFYFKIFKTPSVCGGMPPLMNVNSVLIFQRARQLYFFYVQILTEFKNRFVFKEVDLICWVIIKVKLFYKISGIKFSSLELILSGFAVKPPPMKELKERCGYK